MKKAFVIMILLSIGASCSSQDNNRSLIEHSREASSTVVNDFFSHIVKDKEYLLFSIRLNWYLIIVRDEEVFKKYYLCMPSEESPVKIEVAKPNQEWEVLQKAFDKNIYHKDGIDLNSDFYENGYDMSTGNPTYFYFSDQKGIMYGESQLTTFIKPNPINKETYIYVLTDLLAFIDSDSC